MKTQKSTKKIFSDLIRKHQGIIHKITYVYADNHSDREDLFQEICLQLWKSYSKFREESQFSTWLYRVALNTAINNIRKKKTSIQFDPTKDIDIATSDSSNERERVNSLYNAISKLNRIDKAIIILWLEEKSYCEIASIIGTTKSNISVKLVRIKRRLEEMVNK